MPFPIAPGVLGIARTMFARPHALRRFAMPVPAAMEIISAPDRAMGRNRIASVLSTCGFSATTQAATEASASSSTSRNSAIRFVFASPTRCWRGFGSTAPIGRMPCAVQLLMSAPPIRPAPTSRIRLWRRLCLACTLENRRRNGFFRGLSAPEHELERRIVMLARLDGEIEERFALRGTRARVRENHGVPEHQRAFVGKEIEMSDPELGIDVHEERRHLRAAGGFHAHLERRGEMQRLQIIAPGETEMMVAPAAGHGKIELVAPASLEWPAVVFDRPFEHVERMEFDGRLFLMGQAHRQLLMLIGKTKQLAFNLTQDFVFRQESALQPFWGRCAIHNFGGAPACAPGVVSFDSSSASRASSRSFSLRAFDAIAFTASNSSRGTKSMSATRRSSRCRMNVSSSVRTLWAAPAASVKKRASPSSSGLSVCMGHLMDGGAPPRQARRVLTLTRLWKAAFFAATPWLSPTLISIRCSFTSGRSRSAGTRSPISPACSSAGGISFSSSARPRSGGARHLAARRRQQPTT